MSWDELHDYTSYCRAERPPVVELFDWQVYALKTDGTWQEFAVQAASLDDASSAAHEEMTVRGQYANYRAWWVHKRIVPARFLTSLECCCLCHQDGAKCVFCLDRELADKGYGHGV